MKTIAIVNEKGGTGKTTTAVNLAASLGEMGKKVLLVDLDGQAAASRWFGVEEDNRLSDAMLRGGGLKPIPNVAENLWLAPASGRLDSISHELRPTQGGQLRKVLSEHTDYDYTLIDSPPSLGNKLIGNALLAATHAIAPVEPSILALDGLGILLTTLGDIRDGFGHNIILIGAVACRYDARTRLSRLVVQELRRALPGRVFKSMIRETVRMQECPASGSSILDFAPNCAAANDYRAMAEELIAWPPKGVFDEEIRKRLIEQCELDPSQAQPVELGNLRRAAIKAVCEASGQIRDSRDTQPAEVIEEPATEQIEEPATEQVDEVQPTAVEQEAETPVEAPATEQSADETPEAGSEAQSEGWIVPVHIEANASADTIDIEPVFEEEIETPAEAQAVEQPVDEALQADSDAGSEEWIVPVHVEADASAETVDIEPDHLDGPQDLTFGKRLARTTVGPAVLLVGLVLLGLVVASGGRTSPQIASADAIVDTWQDITAEQFGTVGSDIVSVFESPETLAAIADTVDAQKNDDVLYQNLETAQSAPQPADDMTSDVEEAIEQLQDQLAAVADAEPEIPAEPQYRTCPAGYKLTCVFASPNGSQAIVNGQLVRIGDTVKGAKVLAITTQSVEMELNAERFMLGIGEQAAVSPDVSE